MNIPRILQLTAALASALFVPMAAAGSALGDLADTCMAAIEANDGAAFQTAAEALMHRKDVFDTDALRKAEKCLSLGFGEPWEYWFPADEFQSRAAIDARIAATADAKNRKVQEEADAKANAERLAAERQANAERVANMVYVACSITLKRDQVAAMTNSVCVESFLANGLPPT